MDEKDFKKARRQIMRATLELETKALNYLMVANGAGLAGCPAGLKDYHTVPEIHGIGALIALVGTGLILGTLAFVSFQAAHLEVMRRVLVEDETPGRAVFFLSLSNLVVLPSGGAFILAVIVIISKLSKL